jgi:hypothetical protein
LKQAITGFNQDELGDRVTSEEARNKMIGRLIECRLYDRLMNKVEVG